MKVSPVLTTLALCLLAFASPLEERAANVKNIRSQKSSPVAFCYSYLSTTKKVSPFSNLKPSAVSSACSCITSSATACTATSTKTRTTTERETLVVTKTRTKTQTAISTSISTKVKTTTVSSTKAKTTSTITIAKTTLTAKASCTNSFTSQKASTVISISTVTLRESALSQQQYVSTVTFTAMGPTVTVKPASGSIMTSFSTTQGPTVTVLSTLTVTVDPASITTLFSTIQGPTVTALSTLTVTTLSSCPTSDISKASSISAASTAALTATRSSYSVSTAAVPTATSIAGSIYAAGSGIRDVDGTYLQCGDNLDYNAAIAFNPNNTDPNFTVCNFTLDASTGYLYIGFRQPSVLTARMDIDPYDISLNYPGENDDYWQSMQCTVDASTNEITCAAAKPDGTSMSVFALSGRDYPLTYFLEFASEAAAASSNYPSVRLFADFGVGIPSNTTPSDASALSADGVSPTTVTSVTSSTITAPTDVASASSAMTTAATTTGASSTKTRATPTITGNNVASPSCTDSSPFYYIQVDDTSLGIDGTVMMGWNNANGGTYQPFFGAPKTWYSPSSPEPYYYNGSLVNGDGNVLEALTGAADGPEGSLWWYWQSYQYANPLSCNVTGSDMQLECGAQINGTWYQGLQVVDLGNGTYAPHLSGLSDAGIDATFSFAYFC